MSIVPISQEAADKKKQKRIDDVKFPKIFKKPVDLKMVNLEVINSWVKATIEKLLGSDDDIVINFVNEMLVDELDIKEIYLQLKGFLEDQTLPFCTELWELLLEAQESRDGIPEKLKKYHSKIVNPDRRPRSGRYTDRRVRSDFRSRRNHREGGEEKRDRFEDTNGYEKRNRDYSPSRRS
ncbi:BA75_02641T0 [Komagataella pastoris]|uniref:U1 small nuclear ribonucleoprotein component SNU71 n=1 Tax=Komagataella pastoris TaxID=4922 RepID=A0A1B2JC03_PICPA|nr:BA75_02641T0 [Komagataella pastoris]